MDPSLFLPHTTLCPFWGLFLDAPTRSNFGEYVVIILSNVAKLSKKAVMFAEMCRAISRVQSIIPSDTYLAEALNMALALNRGPTVIGLHT